MTKIAMTDLSYKSRFAVGPDDVLSELRKHMLIDGFDYVLDLNRSHGSWFVDARSGKEFLDFFSCIASMPIGINHPKMVDPEFVEHIGMMALNKPSNSDIYSEAQATFVKTFFELAVPSHFKYGFFIEGGTLAVENALKVAMDWKIRKGAAAVSEGGTRGTKILHFERAFHGRSGYSMSLTNTDPAKTALWPKFPWPRVSPPVMKFPQTHDAIEDVVNAERVSIEQIKQAFRANPDEIAAIIIEPIQGEGGDNHFRPEFLQALRSLCNENEALLIFDEVQTGVGLTGSWWMHEAVGVQPDIMCFGKKMQVCGILVTDRIDDVPENVFHTSSRINSTWGGSLVDMVRATRYLEIISEEDLVGNAARVGQYLLEQIVELGNEFPTHVSNARGRGLMCAFDMPSSDARKMFLTDVYNNGLLMVGSGTQSIRFRPALNMTEELIDAGIDIIRLTLASMPR
jgi:L-lysine 6-transaminase